MSLKIVQAENGFTITKIEFQQKQEIWVCSTVNQLAEFQKKQKVWVCRNTGELASFILGYYEDHLYTREEIADEFGYED